MLGPVLRDPWLAYRTDTGCLDATWFSTTSAWSERHKLNLIETFRLNQIDGGESYHWRALDVWTWSPNVVLFGGVWYVCDKRQKIVNAFDAMLLSMPDAHGENNRNDVVLLEDIDTDLVLPTWYQHPLAQQVSPLWWRANKDLPWSIKFAKLLVAKTDKQQWLDTGVVDDLIQSIPIFSRVWNTLRTTEETFIAIPSELPLPTWASADEDVD